MSWLGRQRLELEARLAARGLDHTLSAARFMLHRRTVALVERFATGDALDVGAGRSPYRELLDARCDSVTSMDVERRSDGVDLIGDVQDMTAVEACAFDTILCTQVLEHVSRPWDAVGEIRRVLRPGGRLILSVPHLSAVHEAPHDYYRYTRYGLTSLCAGASLEVVEINEVGGLLSFVGHGVSYALMSSLGAIPGLRWVTWGVNYLILCRLLGVADSILGMRSVYPCNLTMVARRKAGARRE